jgi:hypothetical protein
MFTSPRRRPPLLVLALTALVAAAAVPAPAAADKRSPQRWTRTLELDLSPSRLGLAPGAPARRLALRAIRRHRERIGLGRAATLRLDRALVLPGADGARPVRVLRFQQTVHGLRVVWSQIDVTVVAHRVSSIEATVVRVRGSHRLGRAAVGRAEAGRTARTAVRGSTGALRPRAATFAGNPTAPARPRRVWVVEVGRPAAEGDDAPSPLCVVVDARTGKVVAKWAGMADRPDRGRDARGAEPATAALAGLTQEPLQVTDATAGLPGRTYARFETAGDARVNANWPSYVEARIRPPVPGADAASANAANVARTICNVRGYCGRDGGFRNRTPDFPGSVFPWIVYGNHPGGTSRATSDFRIELSHIDVMGVGANPNLPANDVIAHEFGHVMDWVYAGDRTFEGDVREEEAVQEALADMFAYDYDRADATIAEDTQRSHPVRNLANPSSLTDVNGAPYPTHIRQYDSTPPSAHFNSTILTYAYHLLVQAIGHPKAGRVLHNVPATLSPKPTFREVARGFVGRAGKIYPQDGPDPGARSDAREDAERAFDQVGIGVRDHRGEG